jgi:hypothetical protein
MAQALPSRGEYHSVAEGFPHTIPPRDAILPYV